MFVILSGIATPVGGAIYHSMREAFRVWVYVAAVRDPGIGKSKANSGVGSGVEPEFQLLLNFNFIVGGEVLLLLFSTSKFTLNPNFSLLPTSLWI